MITGLEYLSYEGSLRELGVLSLKRRLRGDPINVYTYVVGGNEKGTRLYSVVPTWGIRGNGHKLKRGGIIPFEQEETHFHCEGGRTLAQFAQKFCGICIHRDIQIPAGHSPGQPMLVDCA